MIAKIRIGTKSERILAMLRRDHGATLAELRDVTGWQANSIRCFISTSAKNLGCAISSVKDIEGQRRYRIKP